MNNRPDKKDVDSSSAAAALPASGRGDRSKAKDHLGGGSAPAAQPASVVPLPCPFCGGAVAVRDEIQQGEFGQEVLIGYSVQCVAAGCVQPCAFSEDTPELVTQLWNRRALLAAPAAPLAAREGEQPVAWHIKFKDGSESITLNPHRASGATFDGDEVIPLVNAHPQPSRDAEPPTAGIEQIAHEMRQCDGSQYGHSYARCHEWAERLEALATTPASAVSPAPGYYDPIFEGLPGTRTNPESVARDDARHARVLLKYAELPWSMPEVRDALNWLGGIAEGEQP